MTRTVGIVLAGGESRRMGTDKAQLVFAGSALLDRAAQALAPHCAVSVGGAGIVVVTGAGSVGSGARQLSDDLVQMGVVQVQDEVPGRGPLQGLATGLAEAAKLGAAQAVVLSTDLPLITPAVVAELITAFEASGVEALLGDDGARTHPLIGVCSTGLVEPLRAALASGERRMLAFFDTRRTINHLVTDPLALTNVNTPEEWEAIARLGSKL